MISVLHRHRLVITAAVVAPLAVLLSGCAGLAGHGTASAASGTTTAAQAQK